MNSYSVVQFAAFCVYLVLIVIALRHRHTQARLNKVFLVYLGVSAGWSLSSFLAHADFNWHQPSIWTKFVPFFSVWTTIALAHFVGAFVRRNARRIAVLGYGYLAVITLLILLGYIPQNAYLADGTVHNDYGSWLYILTIGSACFIGAAVFLLVRGYRASSSPRQRNRITYLLAGISLLVVFGFLFVSLPRQTYAVDHLGHLGMAAAITYAILKGQLLDIKLVARRGLAYSGITIAITALYLVLLTVLQHFLETWTTSSVLAIGGVAIVMAWLFDPLRKVFHRLIDRLFYGETYDYRQTVRSFASRMSNVLDLEELAEAMLGPITKAVRAGQASLLLAEGEYFSSRFASRLAEGEPVTQVSFRQDSPVVSWITRENKPLSRQTIDIAPEFKGLWQTERKELEAAQIELICPMMSKGNLVGILALSKKESRGFYSTDDRDMLMTMAQEAAIVVENAQLYALARQRANTDELTGLFNHRFFHQRLDEEIARCSRFGHIFSLIFLDLDLFKTYNDVHGHLAGDDILVQVAQHIKSSIRSVDIGARYGGDEFAVLLPQTSLDDAYKVAERIRRRIEIQTESKGLPLTCSCGIASWPTDGVMREEIIRAADAALYYTKQVGRNRISLASEVALSQVLKMEVKTENTTAVLSTIYALAATVDAKDHYTYGHSKKVAKYAADIAYALGYSEDRMAIIRAAALLHDIGKIGISDRLLVKTGPLSDEDWEPIMAHPNLGVAILKHVEGLKECLAAVQYHHEHYDGTGYPAGLKEDNIPLDARILAVADAYDAMTSLRPYRPGKLTHEQALAELRRCAGTQFDPKIVAAFTNIFSLPLLESAGGKQSLVAGLQEK